MAERQGLLTGAALSPVQVYGLNVLIFLDDAEKFKAERNSFKYAMAAREEFSPEKIFPEYFKDDAKTVENGDLATADEVDYSEVEWKSPKDAMDEFEAVMAQLNNHGELTGDDLTGGSRMVDIEWTEWQ